MRGAGVPVCVCAGGGGGAGRGGGDVERGGSGALGWRDAVVHLGTASRATVFQIISCHSNRQTERSISPHFTSNCSVNRDTCGQAKSP